MHPIPTDNCYLEAKTTVKIQFNIKLEKEKGRRRGEIGLLTTGTANSSADHFSFTYNLCEDKTYIQTIYIAAPTYFNSSMLLLSCQSIENLR